MADLSRAEHIADQLARIAEAHVAAKRAEQDEEARRDRETRHAVAVTDAQETARRILGDDAAAVLAWEPRAFGVHADLGNGLVLEHDSYPWSPAQSDGPPGFLHLVRRCGCCGYRWSEQVDSLEHLAYLLKRLPKETFFAEADS